MSRSYKKYPHSTSTIGYFKTYSNKKNRQKRRRMLHEYELGNYADGEAYELGNGGRFKRNHETYSIRDFISIYFSNSFPEATSIWFDRIYPTYEDWKRELDSMRRK